jgi:hypothetical protein
MSPSLPFHSQPTRHRYTQFYVSSLRLPPELKKGAKKAPATIAAGAPNLYLTTVLKALPEPAGNRGPEARPNRSS